MKEGYAIQPLALGAGEECSLIACLKRVMEGFGHRFTYEELMGWSGNSFIISGSHRDRNLYAWASLLWMAGAPFACECAGFSVRTAEGDGTGETYEERLAPLLRDALGLGAPAVVRGLSWGGHWSLVLSETPAGLRCLSVDEPAPREVTGRFPDAVVVINHSKFRTPKEKALYLTLKHAVGLAWDRATNVEFEGVTGFAAWTLWIERLLSDEDGKELEGGWWLRRVVMDGREAASRYLKGLSDGVSPRAGVCLSLAAEHYSEVAGLLGSLGPDADVRSAMKTRWAREDLAATIKAAMEREERAVLALEEALVELRKG